MGMEPKTAGGQGALPEAASTDIGNRRHQILPALNEAQFELLSRYGERRHFKAGDISIAPEMMTYMGMWRSPPGAWWPTANSSSSARIRCARW